MLPGQLNLRKSILISSASSCGKMMEFRYVLRGFGSCGLEEIVNGFPHTFYKRCAVRRIPSIWFDPFLSLFWLRDTRASLMDLCIFRYLMNPNIPKVIPKGMHTIPIYGSMPSLNKWRKVIPTMTRVIELLKYARTVRSFARMVRSIASSSRSMSSSCWKRS